ncbi:hypothetical protein KCP75_02885 [Salmonella enterica subsp. enterica]|nr:hypothetical protein KCP75_02885 [Salmonella enterica subsp. enterica]
MAKVHNSFPPNEAEREDRFTKAYFAEQRSPMLVILSSGTGGRQPHRGRNRNHWLAVVP